MTTGNQLKFVAERGTDVLQRSFPQFSDLLNFEPLPITDKVQNYGEEIRTLFTITLISLH